MNWGYKIMFVYIAFAIGITAMVIKSSSQKIDLVTEDYYAKELKYQDNIDANKRTGELASKVKYEVADGKLVISLPKEFTSKEVTGSLLLYCPSDDGKDIRTGFTTISRTVTTVLPATIKGAFQIQLSWVADGNAYYFEEKIFF